MEKKAVRFEAEPKPEIEGIIEIIPDTSEFDEPEKAQAIIKNLSLSVGDTIKENEECFTINPRMVLRGTSPEEYKRNVEEFKKILTKKEIKEIDNYIKRKKEDEKIRDKIYYGIEKRTDKFFWRGNIKKSVPVEIKEVLEYFKGRGVLVGIHNTLYHLLNKGEEDYLICYKCAWENKPIPNIQEWGQENDGEYMILTDSEADYRANEYLTDDEYLWKCAVESGNTTAGLEEWAEDVLNMDGRGSVLSGYDGSEDYEKIDETDYYIYRTN